MIQQPSKHRLYMKILLAAADRILVLPLFPGLDRTYQDILRRMLHIDEFQYLGIISFVLQILGPKRIRHQRRHALLDQPISKDRLQCLIVNLPVQFMLTAGNGKDHLRIPANGFRQGEVRSRVAERAE